jgi:hypothetical protein
MIQSANISRRSFLSGLVYLSSWGFMQLVWPLRTSAKTDGLAVKLARFYVDKESAKCVGLEYLRSVPTEANVAVLVDVISSFDVAQRAELYQADQHKLKELLHLRQRQDFEHERVVNVRGWILSETECRLCALTALI